MLRVLVEVFQSFLNNHAPTILGPGETMVPSSRLLHRDVLVGPRAGCLAPSADLVGQVFDLALARRVLRPIAQQVAA